MLLNLGGWICPSIDSLVQGTKLVLCRSRSIPRVKVRLSCSIYLNLLKYKHRYRTWRETYSERDQSRSSRSNVRSNLILFRYIMRNIMFVCMFVYTPQNYLILCYTICPCVIRVSRTTSVTRILNNLQWTSLKDRRTISRLSTLHKARLGLIALPMDDLLQPLRRPSRHSCQIAIK